MKIPNKMLLANAGSGKTHALTTRMVKLLAGDVEPGEIAALTFTRKAAGEFLDAVFRRIAEAAIDPVKLASLRKDTGNDQIDVNLCISLLVKLAKKAGALRMGTIDGFFARIARAFPLESGLPGEFRMIGESELKHAREEALAAVFREQVGDGDGTKEFVDLVRRASRRDGEIDVFSTLYKVLEKRHEAYLETPREARWGNEKTIWPEGNPYLDGGDPAEAAEMLREAIHRNHPDLDPEVKSHWEEWLDMAAEVDPMKPWSPELKEFIDKKLLNVKEDSKTGELYLTDGNGKLKRVYLRGEVAEGRDLLLRALLKRLFQELLRMSGGQYDFMERFERAYDARTRSSGLLTFQDVTDLLSRHVKNGHWMASVGYRLDGTINHWLLDEFQDTSRIQWKVLGTFICEVIQDNGEGRSLFYVGDTKQAIYSWRGGDSELFFEIFDYYNRNAPKIEREPLSVSQRSARVIVETVNAVFKNIGAYSETLGYPKKTVSDWERAWTPHKVAQRNESLAGYVRWVQAQDNPQASEEDQIHRQDLETLKILQEVQPWNHGKSCAVLVRTNDQLTSIAQLLQSEEIPISVEGKSNPCMDNPLGAMLLAAMRLAASPGDTLSRALLGSSTLGKSLLGDGEQAFRQQTFNGIAAEGYEETIRGWIGAMETDAFFEERGREFLRAASEYDASARGPVTDFVSFIENRRVEEPESSGVVRLMTLHQSKGLTFDMTVVSGLDRESGRKDEKIHLCRDKSAERIPQWGCLMPKKDLARLDEKLGDALEQNQTRESYEKLCIAYVGMTRSKHALYVVTNQIKPDSKAKNFGRLLRLTLNTASSVYEKGNASWYERKEEIGNTKGSKDQTPSVPAEKPKIPACSTGTPHALSPSSLALKVKQSKNAPGKSIFSSEAAELGTEIHDVLSRIGWDIFEVDLASCTPEANRLLKEFLKSAEAKALFTQPGEEWDFWNEKSFDLLDDNQWVSGVFDRVHVRWEGGKAMEAHIYDYKTNRSTPEAIAKEYEGQMEQYRKATSKLLGIDIEKVSARTVPIRTK